MSKVDDLLRQLGAELQGVEKKIAGHGYVVAAERGKLTEESLSLFAAEQLRIITGDLRSVAYLVARADTNATSDFFSFVLVGEQVALANLERFAAALGTDFDTLSQREPLAAAQTYRNYMAWLALQGSMAGVASAYLVNFPAWGENCGRLAAALKANYGMDEEQVSFFTGFATPSREFADKAKLVIAEGLEKGVAEREIRTVARLLQEYELMYWDAVWAVSK